MHAYQSPAHVLMRSSVDDPPGTGTVVGVDVMYPDAIVDHAMNNPVGPGECYELQEWREGVCVNAYRVIFDADGCLDGDPIDVTSTVGARASAPCTHPR